MNTENPQAQTKSVQSLISDIKKDVEAGYEKIVKTKRAIIIVGNTGDGKSTLLNYIAGNPLIAQKNKRKRLFSLKAEKILNKWVDQITGIVYWILPGFNDTKGVEQDIVNAFYTKRIFDTSDEVKIVIVASQASTSDKEQKFLNVLQKLENLFPKLQQIIKSVCLIYTKTSIDTQEELKQQLQQFLQNHAKYIPQKQKLLLKHLSSEVGKVAVFPFPQKEGFIDMSGNILIKKIIDSTLYVQKPPTKITVSDGSLSALEEIGKILNQDIAKICNDYNRSVEQLCSQKIKSSTSYESVKSDLVKIRNYLKQIKKPSLIQEFLANCRKMNKDLKINFEFDKVTNSINLLQFICEIKPKIQISMQKWKNQFCTASLIDKMLQEPKFVISPDKTSLTIFGCLFKMAQVKKILPEKRENLPKFVSIICYHAFYVDQDLVAPGVNLSIISKNVFVIGNRSISLKGLTGQQYQKSAANQTRQDYKGNGLKGYDGLPGRPGQPGGSFFGKITQKNGFFGPGKLIVDVSGGDGGKGQDGGDGAEGCQGVNADPQAVVKRQKSALISINEFKWDDKDRSQKFNQVWKTVLTLNVQMLETYRTFGTKRKRGGDGGRKGAGGLVGCSGDVRLQSIKPQILQDNSALGYEGKPGNPGKGGKNGKNYEGKYVDESAFTSTSSTIGRALGLAGILPVQAVISPISALISSGWQSIGYVSNGFALSGSVPNEPNTNLQEKPKPSFKITDNHVQQLEKEFMNYQNEVFKSLGFKPYFL